MRFLVLYNITFTDGGLNAFSSLATEFIAATDYHICCSTSPTTVCEATSPWFFSCKDLLPKMAFKILFILYPLVILIVNLLSFVSHLSKRSAHTALSFSFIIAFINFTNLVYCCYLFGNWTSDFIFRGMFSLGEQNWRSCPVCFMLFQIVFLFSLLNQFGLLFLSLARLMVVLHPVDSRFKRTSFVWKSLFYGFVGSLLMTSSISFLKMFTVQELPTSLCLPFVDPTGLLTIIRIVTYFVGITQSTSSVSILVMHVYLVSQVQNIANFSYKSCRRSHDHTKHINRVIQLFILTISNLLSWLPANIIFLALSFLDSYSLDLI